MRAQLGVALLPILILLPISGRAPASARHGLVDSGVLATPRAPTGVGASIGGPRPAVPGMPTAIDFPDSACVPSAVGVPHVVGAAPRWWNVDGDGAFPEMVNPNGDAEMNLFDDPRWNQAVSFMHGPTATQAAHVDFRALFDASNLYLSWEILTDPVVNDDGSDEIWVAFSQTGGAQRFAINIRLRTKTPGVPGIGNQLASYDIGAASWNGTKFDPIDPIANPGLIPGWIRERTRVWVKTGSLKWAVQMEIPRAGIPGVTLGTEFNLWYQVLVNITDPAVNQSPYPWPRGSSITADYVPDALDKWGQIYLGTPPPMKNCRGDVALYYIGNLSGPTHPTSKITFTDPAIGPNTVIDTLYARPTNLHKVTDPNPDIGAHAISANFFIANWGSVADLAGVWLPVTSTLSPPPHDNAATIPAANTAHGEPNRNDIQLQWKLSKCEIEDYLPGSSYSAACTTTPPRTKRKAHQCMLVELSGSPGLTFVNKSTYRNMDFDTASEFRREAEISVVGLDPLPGGHPTRTVYLWVETHHLPERAEPPGSTPDTIVVPSVDSSVAHEGEVIVGPAQIVPHGHQQPITLGVGDSMVVRDSATVIVEAQDTILIPANGADRGAMVRAAADSGQLTPQQIDSLMPTYRVHVYHETGDTLDKAGVKHAFVEAQSSFGYWLDHTGALQGWRHRIEGATLVQLAPDFYKLAVPNNGVATVTTTIEAIEHEGVPWWVWLLILLLILILYLMWRRRTA